MAVNIAVSPPSQAVEDMALDFFLKVKDNLNFLSSLFKIIYLAQRFQLRLPSLLLKVEWIQEGPLSVQFFKISCSF